MLGGMTNSLRTRASAVALSMMGVGLALLTSAGCGDGSRRVPMFVGTWSYSSTTVQTLACPRLNLLNSRTPIWDVVLSRGSNADLSYTDGEGCMYGLDIAGDVASFRPGQSCETTITVDGTVAPLIVMPASATLTLTAPDKMAESASGTATLTVGGAAESCTVGATGTLTRL
jgi:hypothetical protein